MLTRKQHRLLSYIFRCLHESGVPPSFDEMKEELGLKSKSGVHRLVIGLEERGFINRLPNRARAIEVIKFPDNIRFSKDVAARFAATSDHPDQRQHPSHAPLLSNPASDLPPSAPPPSHRAPSTGKRHSSIGNFSVLDTPPLAQNVTLSLFGKIAAGTPIEALRDETANIEIPAHLIGQGEHFALEVEGDSMIEAGILERDIVIIRRADTAENGHIVVALIDGEEVTLKRLRQRGHSIALEPANKNYETRIFGPDRIRIQGALVGLIRRYD